MLPTPAYRIAPGPDVRLIDAKGSIILPEWSSHENEHDAGRPKAERMKSDCLLSKSCLPAAIFRIGYTSINLL